jgi:hypothetical protein
MNYRLLREHRINKILHPVGSEVSLPEQLGDWLVEQAVVERADNVAGAAKVVSVPRTNVKPAEKARLNLPRFKCCGWK